MAQAPAGGRVPPSSLQAEKSVLGAMMLSQEAMAAAAEGLVAADFYYEINGRIFEAMMRLYRHAQPVDFVTLTDQLEKDGTLQALGGYDYISEINRFVPLAANVGEYIKIVSEKSMLRRLIDAAGKITEECYAGEKPIDVILSDAEKAIFAVTQSRQTKNFVSIQEALDATLERIELLHEDPDALAGLRTGYRTLDQWTGGFRAGELILLAARPSMGKTALELNIAEQAARLNENAVIALFSLEMPYEDLAARMLSTVGYLPLQNLRSGKLQGQEWEKLQNASTTLGNTEIYIDDSSGITIMEMRSKCRRLKLERGLSMVMIDYLQLITSAREGGGGDGNRQQEVAEITRALKIMARELDVPIVLLSQLSRGPERRDNHRPLLSDLRDSGAIEQDADVVLFLFREAYYANEKTDVDPASISNEGEIIIAKNRNGPTGTVKVLWDGANASFRDIDASYVIREEH